MPALKLGQRLRVKIVVEEIGFAEPANESGAALPAGQQGNEIIR